MTFAPTSVDEFEALLRARPGRLRLRGSGSRQARLPPAELAHELAFTGLDRIERIDAPDQTCTVEAGVTRAALDAELHRVGLELPCPGGGTIGGLFASDAVGAAGAGGASPRTLLLGMDGMLADGTPFKAGARVVKSVAGFDVHKLLIGSQGRLFAAMRLHLRLKPRPRCEQWFCREGLDVDAACRLLAAMRLLPVPPSAVQLQRDGGGCRLRGRFGGRANFVHDSLRAFELPASDACWLDHLAAPAQGEVLSGCALISQLPDLLAKCAPQAPFLMLGGGRFEVICASVAESDALLRGLQAMSVPACIVHGEPERRGIGTTLDPGEQRLAVALKQALDPHGILV